MFGEASTCSTAPAPTGVVVAGRRAPLGRPDPVRAPGDTDGAGDGVLAVGRTRLDDEPRWVARILYEHSATRMEQGMAFSRWAGHGWLAPLPHRVLRRHLHSNMECSTLPFQPKFTATAANVLFYWSHDIGQHLQQPRQPLCLTYYHHCCHWSFDPTMGPRLTLSATWSVGCSVGRSAVWCWADGLVGMFGRRGFIVDLTSKE